MKIFSGLLAFSVALMFSGVTRAQDSRQVKEPQVPAVCSIVSSQMENAVAISTTTRAVDTSRLQAAMDACKPGQAVRLSGRNGKTAFLSGSLQIPSGVSLLLDTGVTLFASRHPLDYDKGNGSCGSNDEQGKGCNPFILADHTQASGIYGEGIIDGQGGGMIVGKTESWWQIARRAQAENNRQNVPRLIEVTASRNFNLHRINLKNSANFHVTLHQVDGFTAWGVRIDTPANARNTDGIDPISSRNITIAHSYIRTGDDNIAIKAGNSGPSENITIRENHFYSGHGMSIGSETNGNVSKVLVENLSMDGSTSGLRIKSDISRGGLVQNIVYRHICLRNIRTPLEFVTNYTKNARGNLIPHYRDIKLEHVQSVSPGNIFLQGYDAEHPLQIQMNDVSVARGSKISTAHLQLAGAGGTMNDTTVQQILAAEAENSSACDQAFTSFPDTAVKLRRPQLDASMARQFAYGEVLQYAGLPGAEQASPWDPLAHPVGLSTDEKSGIEPDYIVDAKASADGARVFSQVQAAINQAVLDMEKNTVRRDRIHIQIKPGIYRELVYIPETATAITLYASDAASTKITANLDAAVSGKAYTEKFEAQFSHAPASVQAMYASLKDRPTLGTFGSAVMWVKSPGFQVKNITIENAYNKDKGNARAECQPGSCPDTGIYAQMLMVHHQALALMLDGADQAHFDGVRLLGFQDTLYMKAGKDGRTARQFFYRSYIEGDVDFIFGDATAYFLETEIKSLGDRSSSYVAAPSTNVKARFGFVFERCRFTHDGSSYAMAGRFYLARQWFHNQRCTPYGALPVAGYSCQLGETDQYASPAGTITKKTLESVGKMVVMNSVIGGHINKTQPWSDWNKNGTLPYRPAQFSSDDYWANLLTAKIDPVTKMGYAQTFTPNRIFLAEFNNTEE